MNKDHQGMTLLEVIVVLSIVAILGAAGTTTYFQVMKGSGMSNNRAQALSDIERAADLFTVDALQAQERPKHLTLEPPTEINRDPAIPVVSLTWPVTLTWIDDNNDWHKVVYYFVGTSFKRDFFLDVSNDNQGYIIQSTTTVARNICNDTICKYNWMKDIYFLTITAKVGKPNYNEAIETRKYEIISRTNLD